MPKKNKEKIKKTNSENKIFTWEGKNKRGQVVKGEMSSTSIVLVKAQLRKQHIKPIKVRKKNGLTGTKKIKPMDIALFTRQLSTMVKAGVPLLQSFDIALEGIDNPTMKSLLLQVKQDVSGGDTLTAALKKHPKYFDELYCSLVSAGESSGALDVLLERIASYKEKTETLKNKIKKAMTYPIVVILVALGVSALLLIKVVPQFEEVFRGFGAELPAFTQMVINLSEVLQANWLYFIVVIVVLFFSGRGLLQVSASARYQKDKWLLRLPVIGGILKKSVVARFTRTLSTTFSAGVPLVDALNLVAGSAGNVLFKEATYIIRNEVATGQQLHRAMKYSELFPSMVIQMVTIGEESGTLDTMLDKIAVIYEEEVDNAVEGLTSMLEPFIMAVLGVLVGGLIVAMYLPIFKLGSVV